MATLLNPFIRALDANGDAVSGGQLAVFEAGTTTPVTTYSDRALTTAQDQPLIANSAGEFEQSFVASGIYKIRVSDAGGVTLYENDNVRISDRPDDPVYFDTTALLLASEDTYAEGTFVLSLREGQTFEAAASGATDHNTTNAGGQKFYLRDAPSLDLQDVATLLADTSLTYSSGAGKVASGNIVRTRAEGFSYQVAESAATDHHVSTSGGVKLYVLPEEKGYNVKAFGAAADGTTDDGPIINAAIAAIKQTISGNGSELTGPILYFPAGIYQTEENIDLTENSGVSIVGDGGTKSSLRGGDSVTKLLNFDGSNNYRGIVEGMRLTGGIGGATFVISSHLGGGNQIHYKNCWIDSADTFINTDGLADSTVKDCTFEFIKAPFKGSNFYDFEVTGCMFYKNGPSGAGLQPSPFGFSESYRVLFNFNRIVYDRELGIAAADAMVDFSDSYDCEMIGNIFYDRPGSTYPMRGVWLANAQRCLVSKNNFGRFRRATIEFNNASGCEASGNFFVGVTDGAYYPIFVTNGSVDCNISSNIASQVDGVDYSNLVGTIDILIEDSERTVCTENKTRGVVYVQSTAARVELSGNQKINGGAPLLYSSYPPSSLGKTWERGDYIPSAAPAAAGYLGLVVVTSGTRGTLNGATTLGSITSGTTALTVSEATGLKVGHYISIAGVTGTKRVTAISGTSVTIDSNADATVSGAAVAFVDAVFKGAGLIAS